MTGSSIDTDPVSLPPSSTFCASDGSSSVGQSQAHAIDVDHINPDDVGCAGPVPPHAELHSIDMISPAGSSALNAIDVDRAQFTSRGVTHDLPPAPGVAPTLVRDAANAPQSTVSSLAASTNQSDAGIAQSCATHTTSHNDPLSLASNAAPSSGTGRVASPRGASSTKLTIVMIRLS